jgi:hypothetical protein
VIWKKRGIAVCLTISPALVCEGLNVQDLGTERHVSGFSNYPKFQMSPDNSGHQNENMKQVPNCKKKGKAPVHDTKWE